MKEPAPIDHKDEPGEYRRQVRDGVFSRVGVPGQPVNDGRQLVGVWDVYFVWLDGPQGEPMFVYRLDKGGTATVKATDSQDAPSSGEWRLNQDGTFSLLTWCPADPEFGIPEPQLDEDRRHIAALPEGRLVVWNGDGSSVLLLSPRDE